MVNGDGNGRGRPRSETDLRYHQEVFEYSSSHHSSLHFFLDLISIEIQPIFGEFSSSRIDLSAVGDSAEEEHDDKLADVCTHIKECDVKESER